MYINIKTENLWVRTKFYWSRDGGPVIIVRTVLRISDVILMLLLRILFFFVVSFIFNIYIVCTLLRVLYRLCC